jgi:hypothetical protein
MRTKTTYTYTRNGNTITVIEANGLLEADIAFKERKGYSSTRCGVTRLQETVLRKEMVEEDKVPENKGKLRWYNVPGPNLMGQYECLLLEITKRATMVSHNDHFWQVTCGEAPIKHFIGNAPTRDTAIQRLEQWLYDNYGHSPN